MKKILTACIIIIIAVLSVYIYTKKPIVEVPVAHVANPDVEINLAESAVVTSPLVITGKVRGTWYFEAVFPIELRDAAGTVISRGQGHATGEWMTTDLAPFSATLTFTKPTTKTGILVIINDNPSGMPENAKSFSIPVRFE